MKIFISILLSIVSYLIFSQRLLVYSLTVSVLLGSAVLAMAVLVQVGFFHSFKKEKKISFTLRIFVFSGITAMVSSFFYIGVPLLKNTTEHIAKAHSLNRLATGSSESNGDGSIEKDSLVIGNTESQHINIPERGELTSDKKAVVKILPLDDATKDRMGNQPLYLKIKSLDHFDGISGWSLKNPKLGVIQSNNNRVKIAQSSHVLNTHTPFSYRVIHAKDKNLVHHLPNILEVTLPYLKSYDDSSYYLPGATNSEQTIANQRGYEVVSNYFTLNDIKGSQRYGLKVAEASEHLKVNMLPADLAYKISVTAKQLRSKKSVYTKLSAIRSMLQYNCKYSTTIKNSRGVSPLENFLYYEKKGFCLHYATSAVMLARELGIPSRISFGYVGGTYFKDQNVWVFYTDNAHSWMEVKLDGYGWVVVETVPDEVILTNVADEGSQPEALGVVIDTKVPNAEKESMSLKESMKLIEHQVKVMIVAVALLFICLLLLSYVQKKKNKLSAGQMPLKDVEETAKVKNYIKAYRRQSALNGHPMIFGDTLRQHFSQLEEVNMKPEFADNLLEYHYRTTYFTKKQKNAIEKALIAEIKLWKI